MNNLLINKFIIITLITFIHTGIGFSQEKGKGWFTNVDIKLKTSLAPDFSVGNVADYQYPRKKWIVMELSYTPAKDKKEVIRGETYYRFREDLEIQFEILFATRNSYHILSKKISYSSVHFDGKRNYALALIPPAITDKIHVSRIKINHTHLRKLPLQVSFFLEGVKVDEFFFGARKAPLAFDAARKFSRTQFHNSGIFDRMQTPWGPINFDRYELIKRGRN